MTLRAVDVTHSYDDEAVVEGLSLDVDAGEVVAIIGPSGVGKTTLLRILGLFVEPVSGRIEFDGTEVWDAPEAERLALRRRIGMVFQEASLFDGTVGRNVEYGLRVRRSWRDRLRDGLARLVGSADPPERVREALDVVGMAGQIDQSTGSLSGGEAQRVSFARALAYDPDVLLLDEPTSDLDPRNTAVIEDAVAEARDRGIGVVVATHDMHQAERIADRVGVLLDRRLAEIGPTSAVFDAPEDERTAKFIDGELIY